jgi:hypothetical protein
METVDQFDFDPRKLPHDVLAAVGLAVTSAAQTETSIQWAIAGCLGVDAEYGGCVTTHMAMPLRFSALRSVAEIRIDDLDALDELDRLIETAEKAFEKRNALAHHQWGKNEKTGEIITVRASSRSSYKLDSIPMSVDQIKADALFIYDAGIAIIGFLIKHKLTPAVPTRQPRSHKTKVARKKRREGKLDEI